MVAKAVILAAGKGTRLCPLTPFIPKEMLPVDGFPCVHHVLKEMVSAGITEVMIVLSEEKESIRKYMTESIEPKGEDAVRYATERDRILSSLRITYAYQPTLRGTADAIRLAASFMGDDPLLVVYPDDFPFDVARGEIDRQPSLDLMRICRETGDSVVLSAEVSGRDASKYGVLDLRAREDGYHVSDIVEKPVNYDRERAHVLIGRMVITPRLMATIPRYRLSDGEGIVPMLREEAKGGRLRASLFCGKRYDLGSHAGYLALLRDLR